MPRSQPKVVIRSLGRGSLAQSRSVGTRIEDRPSRSLPFVELASLKLEIGHEEIFLFQDWLGNPLFRSTAVSWLRCSQTVF